jgi:integrase
MGHKRMPGLRFVDGVWHIQKRVRGYGPLRESTQSSSLEEANRYLTRRLEQIREQLVYGVRPKRFFAEAAAKFIEEDVSRSRADNAAWLEQAMPFIGKLYLNNIHDETLKPYVEWCRQPRQIYGSNGKPRQHRGDKGKTIANKLGLIRRILRLAAGKWRDPVTSMTWLESAPMLTIPDDRDKREPYPISWKEQALLFPLLPPHLQRMALFDVHTGLRDDELCGLKWAWEREIEELGVSVFVIPKNVAKNREERVVMLNAVARRIIEEQRGQHEEFVFVYRHNAGKSQGGPGRRNHTPKPARRVGSMNNTGWQLARKTATERYPEVFKRPAPEGFATLHVHDLRHTFGRRLRAAGVPLETRQALLGHKNGNITTHYSAAELVELYRAVEKIEAGASAPLLLSVQKTCSPEMTTGYRVAVSR